MWVAIGGGTIKFKVSVQQCGVDGRQLDFTYHTVCTCQGLRISGLPEHNVDVVAINTCSVFDLSSTMLCFSITGNVV